MITEDEKRTILVRYLGHFAVNVGGAEKAKIRAMLPEQPTTHVIESLDRTFLRKYTCLFLLQYGRLNYRFVNSYDLVDRYFNNSDDDDSHPAFHQYSQPILVLLLDDTAPTNKIHHELITHTVAQRLLEKKHTLILTQRAFPILEKLLKDYPKTSYRKVSSC